MWTLKHKCRCGQTWTQDYPAGAIVSPECPNCGHRVEIVRPKRSAWHESITSELVHDS